MVPAVSNMPRLNRNRFTIRPARRTTDQLAHRPRAAVRRGVDPGPQATPPTVHEREPGRDRPARRQPDGPGAGGSAPGGATQRSAGRRGDRAARQPQDRRPRRQRDGGAVRSDRPCRDAGNPARRPKHWAGAASPAATSMLRSNLAPCAPARSPMPASTGSISARPTRKAARYFTAAGCSTGRPAITARKSTTDWARARLPRCFGSSLPSGGDSARQSLRTAWNGNPANTNPRHIDRSGLKGRAAEISFQR